MEDSYIRFFASEAQKKPPVINRAYWARTYRVWKTLEEFLKQGNKQVVNLGAGYDTTFWVMENKFPLIKYLEVDFEEVCRKKLKIISNHPELSNCIDCDLRGKHEVVSSSYCLVPADLKRPQELFAKLRTILNPELPTLFIAECVLVYLDVQNSNALIQEASAFPNSAFLVFDIIQPNDAFGRTMMENLHARGVHLHGIYDYSTLEANRERYLEYFPRVQVLTMLEVYNQALDSKEKSRIEHIEWLDEFEEWNLLMSHYIMAIACKGTLELKFT